MDTISDDAGDEHPGNEHGCGLVFHVCVYGCDARPEQPVRHVHADGARREHVSARVG